LRDNASKMSKFANTEFLTGMRAYAAVGVLLIHQGGGGLLSLGPVLSRLVQHLAHGVIVFFVLSAVTLAMSLELKQRVGYGNYLLRRFLRVAPLYYVMCLICTFLPPSYWATYFQIENDGWNLLSHLTFLNLFDVGRINGLIGPEWTIAIEMFFYLILPLGAFLARSWRGAAALVGLCYLFTLTVGPWTRFTAAGYEDALHLARHWCPQRYAISFLIGLLTFRLLQQEVFARLRRSWALIVGLMAFAAPLIFDFHLGPGGWTTWYSVLTAWVILTSGGANSLSRLVFENPLALYLGKISYSIYLVHVPILAFMNPIVRSRVLSVPVVLLIVVGVASLTYYFIERPFMLLGRRFRASHSGPVDLPREEMG
jgi:peptidoglycan/LPS O-acetylase OafA/YrhL